MMFRGPVGDSQSTVGSFRIEVFPPFFDQDLSLAQTVEDLAVQELVSEPSVEAFTISILPRAARFNVGRLCADSLDPVLDA